MSFEEQVLDVTEVVSTALRQYPVLVVTDQETYDAAGVSLQRLKMALNELADVFAPEKQARHEAHKAVVTQEKQLAAPVNERFAAIDQARRKWKKEQEAEAERQRKQAEEEARLAAAIEAEEHGEDPDEILDGAVPVPVPDVGPVVRQIKGVSDRKLYRANVSDFHNLIEYVAKNPEWENLLLPNTSALNKLAQAQRELLRIPGVELEIVESTSVRLR